MTSPIGLSSRACKKPFSNCGQYVLNTFSRTLSSRKFSVRLAFIVLINSHKPDFSGRVWLNCANGSCKSVGCKSIRKVHTLFDVNPLANAPVSNKIQGLSLFSCVRKTTPTDTSLNLSFISENQIAPRSISLVEIHGFENWITHFNQSLNNSATALLRLPDQLTKIFTIDPTH